MMGTSTPVKLSAVNVTMTPEECSAEILKLCFGYLPEEIRNSGMTGTVITVPAAFNQMQKDATLAAAEMAGLGSVALMQEPVAAVMCVMKQRKGDGVFLARPSTSPFATGLPLSLASRRPRTSTR
jgi:molecular chaperone DnaK